MTDLDKKVDQVETWAISCVAHGLAIGLTPESMAQLMAPDCIKGIADILVKHQEKSQ